jgi:hypothetical protein
MDAITAQTTGAYPRADLLRCLRHREPRDAVTAGLQKVIDPGDVATVLGFDSHLAVGAVYFFARSSKISIFNFLRS